MPIGGCRYRRSPPLNSVPASPYIDQLSIGAGRRALAIGLSILIPALLLILLSFGAMKPPRAKDKWVSVVSIAAPQAAEEAAAPSASPSKQAETQPLPEPPPDEPVQPHVAAPAAAPAPPAPVPPPVPPATVPRIGVRPPGGQTYGPPNTGGSSSAYRDSERVGTAPNGEPLYAATWYREPSDGELRGYLSTADGPGWGLIACRTAPLPHGRFRCARRGWAASRWSARGSESESIMGSGGDRRFVPGGTAESGNDPSGH